MKAECLKLPRDLGAEEERRGEGGEQAHTLEGHSRAPHEHLPKEEIML